MRVPRLERSEPPPRVAEKVEAHDLEDALPGPRVHVADVTELLDQPPLHARFLGDLSDRRFVGFLPAGDVAFRQRPEPFGLAGRADRGDVPATPEPPCEHPTGRELASHAGFVTQPADMRP